MYQKKYYKYKSKSYAGRRYPRKKLYKRYRSYTSTKRSMLSSNTNSAYLGTVVRGNDFIGITLKNKMEYSTQISFAANTTPQTRVFRGNSIFDPDQTGTGGSAQGFALFAALYSNYECTSCAIRAEFINSSAVPCWIIIAPSTATGNSLDYNLSRSIPGAKTVYCEALNGNAHGVITNFARTYDILQIRDGDNTVLGSMTGNPTSQWYWQVQVYSVDNASTINGVMNVYLTYYTKFSARKPYS